MLNSKTAKTDYPIHSLLANRWSGIALSQKAVSEETVNSLLEAARWASSSYNDQPWKYVVGYKGDSAHKKIADTLMEGNSWAKEAPVLMLSIAKKNFSYNGDSNRHYLYDTGAADMSILLQATELGLVTHQMAGYDIDAIRDAFQIGEDHEPAAVIVIGYPGDVNQLEDTLKEREQSPRSRKSHEDLIWPTS